MLLSGIMITERMMHSVKMLLTRPLWGTGGGGGCHTYACITMNSIPASVNRTPAIASRPVSVLKADQH